MAPGVLEQLQQRADIFNTGLNDSRLSLSNECRYHKQPENGTVCLSRRKRLKATEDALARKRTLISLPHPQQQQQNSSILSHATSGTLTYLPFSFADSTANTAVAIAATNEGKSSSISSIVKEQLQAQVMRENEEFNQIVFLQGARLKHALEQTRETNLRHFLAVLEEVQKRLNCKDAELENLNLKNLQLEEHVKQLRLKSMLWQNIAEQKVMMVSKLKRSLEQIVELEDTESCNQNTEIRDAHSSALKENKKLKDQQSCRACRINRMCILLLPCRHICLCKECEGKLDYCPICNSLMQASVQVCMS